jgi:outer membrane lipoprotein-sorting protein
MSWKHVMTIPLAVLIAATGTARSPAAQTPEERGLEIAREIDRRDSGFKDQKATMMMVLRNRHGQESKREIRTRTLEGAEDGDKTMIVFDQPRDVKGTALLTYTHKVGDDDQWLYLPALKRVKRIASNNKSGPFMGSEFAYEDMTSQEVEKYTYKYLRDEDVDGGAHFVVERYPVDTRSGYTRQIVWVDQVEYIVRKVEFYDRKSELLKTLVLSGYEQYLDKYWRAARMAMVNHQSGKETDLLWSDYGFGNGFKESDFTQTSLKRAK